MIDKWFKKDLETAYEYKKVSVFIDESRESEFLLNFLSSDIKLFKGINNEIDELDVKYQIEKENSDKKYLIYTNTAKDKLKFIREYCETESFIEINNLAVYIREHLNKLNINLNLSDKDIIFASKISVGKDGAYWKDIQTYGKDKIFNIKEEILVLLESSNDFKNRYDDEMLKDFYRKISDFIDYPHNDSFDFKVLARETAKYMFNLIIKNELNNEWSEIYKKLLNSKSHEESLKEYLEVYEKTILNGSEINIWSIIPNHPFSEIDKRWLDKIINEMKNRKNLDNYIEKIKNRLKNKNILKLINIDFWDSLIILLTFDDGKIAKLDSLDKCIEYYKNEFYKLDNAMDFLYKEFLNNSEIIIPIQEKYRNFLDIFLDKWFKYFNQYKQNQTGVLQRIINENSDKKIAIIVADALSYVISKNIINNGKLKIYKCIEDVILCDIPSETENNMSQIYIDTGIVESIHKKREKYLLSKNSNVEFMKIEDVNQNINQAMYLICTHKDIDSIGEELDHNLINYFSKIERELSQKIKLLLESGYNKVYLISDHGFVFTGNLSDSDKINVNFNGELNKRERYIRSVEKQNIASNLIEVKKDYNEYKYLYFAKSISPFSSRGKYGFSHGGLSPQELITPFVSWESNHDNNDLKLNIINKEVLKNVTGNLFKVIIKANSVDNLFSMSRKIKIINYFGNKEVSKSDIITIKKGEKIEKEFEFDKFNELKLIIFDAESNEQLDFVIVRKNNDRDLSGLL